MMQTMLRRLAAAHSQWSAVVAAAAAAVSPEGETMTTQIWHPNEVGLNSHMEKAVLAMKGNIHPHKTAMQIDQKKEEHFQCCDVVCPSDPYRYTLEKDQVYRFMFYQMFREKKKMGGRHSLSSDHRFFDAVEHSHVTLPLMNGTALDVVQPKNPIGQSVFAACKAMFRQLFNEQVADRKTSEHWELTWQACLEDLEKHVAERKPLHHKMIRLSAPPPNPPTK